MSSLIAWFFSVKNSITTLSAVWSSLMSTQPCSWSAPWAWFVVSLDVILFQSINLLGSNWFVLPSFSLWSFLPMIFNLFYRSSNWLTVIFAGRKLHFFDTPSFKISGKLSFNIFMLAWMTLSLISPPNRRTHTSHDFITKSWSK